MPDGKRGNQYQYFFNVADCINAGQGEDKQLMV